jgi:hypothetical protein
MSIDAEFERQMERNARRRVAAEDRAMDRYDRLSVKADPLVGQLMREGKTVFYINICKTNGRLTGKTKEFGRHGDAVDYLMRNDYV